MTQDRIDAVVSDLIKAGFGRALKDLYRDLRGSMGAWEASFALQVACRKEWVVGGCDTSLPAWHWRAIFNRLTDWVADHESCPVPF